jgi:hypothetical protein
VLPAKRADRPAVAPMVGRRDSSRGARLSRVAAHIVAQPQPLEPADDPMIEPGTGRLHGSLTGGYGERDPESAFSGRRRGNVIEQLLDPRPTLARDDLPGADQLGLSPEEKVAFRETGFVVKRGLIPPEALAPFAELWWAQPAVTEAGLLRDDPATWVAPGKHWPATEAEQMLEQEKWGVEPNWMGGSSSRWPTPNDAVREGATIGERVGRLPHKLQVGGRGPNVWRWHGIGHDPEFVAATSAHPRMLHMIEALLGGPVKRPCRNRGVYSVFPSAPQDRSDGTLGPHMDANHSEMMAVTLLRDVGPRGGGFTIWPGSAERLYPTSEEALNWVATPASEAAMDEVKTWP